MKRKTIFIVLAAMVFIALSCAREEVPVMAVEVTGTEEVAADEVTTRAVGYCAVCGYFISSNSPCIRCGGGFGYCTTCNWHAPLNSNGKCSTCSSGGGIPPIDWIDPGDNTDPQH